MNRPVRYIMIWAVGLGLGLAAGKWMVPRSAGELPRGETAASSPNYSPAAAASPAAGTGKSGLETESALPEFTESPPQTREPREGLRAIEPSSNVEPEVVAQRRPEPGNAASVSRDDAKGATSFPGYLGPVAAAASDIPDAPPSEALKPLEPVAASAEPARPLLQTEDAMVPVKVGPASLTGDEEPGRVSAVAVPSSGEATIRAVPVGDNSVVTTAGSGLETKLDPRFLEVAGKRIWMSECAGTKEGLTSWNSGEDFASLGIGHFLWFPDGKEFPFEESFPEYLEYHRMRSVGEELPLMPEWLGKATDCPWATRSEFLKAKDSPEMVSLREFLHDTFTVQVEFIYQRLLDSRTRLFAVGDPRLAAHMSARFDALTETPEGRFAMMDYVNFKGDGTKPEEVFEGEGWGLRQVLGEMKADLKGTDAAVDFARASEAMLRRRVRNHPVDERWIAGWSRRTREYALPFFRKTEAP